MKLIALLLLIWSLSLNQSHAQQAPSRDGAVLWLDFEELVEGQFICAETGAACHVKGTPPLQHGAVVISQYDSISVPALEAEGLTGALTVSAWVAPSERPSSYQTILYKGKREGPEVQDIHFYLSLFDGKPEFKFKDATGKWHGIMRNADSFIVPGGESVPLSKVPTIPARRWSHVAATFDRGHISLYLNGAEILSGQASVNSLTPDKHPLMIGEAQALAGPRSYLFNGLIDGVRIYRRVLPAEKIAGLYEYERQGKPEGEMQIDRPLPEGYDPEFKTKLPLVEAYERNLPAELDPARPVSATVESYQGYPTLHINGEPVYGMAMMPEPYVADELITLSCRDFAAAGVDIYSEIFWSWMTPGEGCSGWWLGPGEYDFEKMDQRIRAIIKANPRALIFPRVKLNPPAWWLAQNPDEITLEADGKRSQQVSLASELWTRTYERMLRDVVRHMESSDYAGHIIGYHPAGGGSSEWFWWGASGRVDYCPAAISRFRSWLSERYQGDLAALRRAWGDDSATFDSAEPPSPEARKKTSNGLFRDPVKACQVIDYQRFLSAMVSHNIVRSCQIVKEETGGRKLAGVFYGYSLYCLNTDGFQGLGEVLTSPYVDFVASPTAYDYRRGGDAGSIISAYTGSYRLHKKLCWDEVDTRTHLFPGSVEYRTESLPETLSVLQRAAGYSLTRGTDLWWFLLAGNATFHQGEVMDDVASLKEACDQSLSADRKPASEVAVFADEDSMYYMTGSEDLRRGLMRGALDELLCMGAPFDLYLLPDIADPNLPDYKLYIFLNTVKVDEDTRRQIDATVKRDGRTVAWVYAPGYVTESEFSEEGMRSLTGISIRATDETLPAELTLTGADHPITSAAPKSRAHRWTISPAFTVDDPEATILGTTGGRPTLAVREFPQWRSVYSMTPLEREVLLGLCRYAGVHVYSETLDPFFANSGYAMIHTATSGPKRIVLPAAADVSEIVTGETIGGGISVVERDLAAGVTRIYRLER